MVIAVGERLEQMDARLFSLFAYVFGNGDLVPLDPHLVVVDVGDHAHQVDNPTEAVFAPHRQLQHKRPRVKAVHHGLHAAQEIGADAVHLVDEGDARHPVLVGLPPHGLRLGLDAADRVEHRHRTVAHPMVMPRSCSWAIQSITAAPSCTSPIL